MKFKYSDFSYLFTLLSASICQQTRQKIQFYAPITENRQRLKEGNYINPLGVVGRIFLHLMHLIISFQL